MHKHRYTHAHIYEYTQTHMLVYAFMHMHIHILACTTQNAKEVEKAELFPVDCVNLISCNY